MIRWYFHIQRITELLHPTLLLLSDPQKNTWKKINYLLTYLPWILNILNMAPSKYIYVFCRQSNLPLVFQALHSHPPQQSEHNTSLHLTQISSPRRHFLKHCILSPLTLPAFIFIPNLRCIHVNQPPQSHVYTWVLLFCHVTNYQLSHIKQMTKVIEMKHIHLVTWQIIIKCRKTKYINSITLHWYSTFVVMEEQYYCEVILSGCDGHRNCLYSFNWTIASLHNSWYGRL